MKTLVNFHVNKSKVEKVFFRNCTWNEKTWLIYTKLLMKRSTYLLLKSVGFYSPKRYTSDEGHKIPLRLSAEDWSWQWAGAAGWIEHAWRSRPTISFPLPNTIDISSQSRYPLQFIPLNYACRFAFMRILIGLRNLFRNLHVGWYVST